MEQNLRAEYYRKWRAKHPDYHKKWLKRRRREDPEWFERKRQKALIASRVKRREMGILPKTKLPKEELNRRRNAARKKYTAKLRYEMLEHYGSLCVCCGEEEPTFLCIDHIDGQIPEMKRFGKKLTAGPLLLIWMKKQNWPSGYQILCYNCNNAIRWGDPCPHQG